MDNKAIIHLVSEAVIILGVSAYFQWSLYKLSVQVKEQAERITMLEKFLDTKMPEMMTMIGTLHNKVESLRPSYYPPSYSDMKPPVHTHHPPNGHFRREQKPSQRISDPQTSDFNAMLPINLATLPKIMNIIGAIRQDPKQKLQEQRGTVVEEEEDSDSDLDDELKDELDQLKVPEHPKPNNNHIFITTGKMPISKNGTTGHEEPTITGPDHDLEEGPKGNSS